MPINGLFTVPSGADGLVELRPTPGSKLRPGLSGDPRDDCRYVLRLEVRGVQLQHATRGEFAARIPGDDVVLGRTQLCQARNQTEDCCVLGGIGVSRRGQARPVEDGGRFCVLRQTKGREVVDADRRAVERDAQSW